MWFSSQREIHELFCREDDYHTQPQPKGCPNTLHNINARNLAVNENVKPSIHKMNEMLGGCQSLLAVIVLFCHVIPDKQMFVVMTVKIIMYYKSIMF